uniref:Neural chondroitin sulphate proteoglycan cytoplasmic domain-containing protein n=1 Tax=Hucho hucho TaxID=62062 RepID=A0A4W5JMC0_9TELE
MWIKGSRCDWVVTDFQVLCVVVGVASLTLVLHIIIVFFAKRLHRFRTENRRLRKRSLYRPQSEMQTDGFSVSMAPDSSHANDDGQKMEDPVKSPFTQGEEYLNIVNSHSPKYMNSPAHSSDHTPNANEEGGVTIGLQLLLPKEAKLRPEASPPLHYSVFLYKKGTGPSTTAANYTAHDMAAARNHSNCSIVSTSTYNKTFNKSNPDINHDTNKHSQVPQNHVPPHRPPHTSPSSSISQLPVFYPSSENTCLPHHASPITCPTSPPPPSPAIPALPHSLDPGIQRHTSPPDPPTSLPLLTHPPPSLLPPPLPSQIQPYQHLLTVLTPSL